MRRTSQMSRGSDHESLEPTCIPLCPASSDTLHGICVSDWPACQASKPRPSVHNEVTTPPRPSFHVSTLSYELVY